VACGAAAGAAAAFHAPIGGMLYLMELSTRWRIELTWRTFFSTSITVLSLNLLTTGCKRSNMCSSILSFVNVAGPGYTYNFSTPYTQLPWMILLAAGLGFLGSMFAKLNGKIVRLRMTWSHSKRCLLIEVSIFFALSVNVWSVRQSEKYTRTHTRIVVSKM
jgi:chloride channel 7